MDFLKLFFIIGLVALACGNGLPHSQYKHTAEPHLPRFGSCPTLTNGPTITNLLDPDNNGVERLVIFAYKQRGTEDILVFTPSKEYQHCIQDFPANAGKFNQHDGSRPIKEMFESRNGRDNPIREKYPKDSPEQLDESNELIFIMDNQPSEPWDLQSPYHEPSKGKYLKKPGKADDTAGYPEAWDFIQDIYNDKGNSLNLQQPEEHDVTGYPKALDFDQSPSSEYDGSGYPTEWDLHQNHNKENDGSGYPKPWDFHQNPYSEYDGAGYPTEWDFHQNPNKEFDGSGYPTEWDFYQNPNKEFDGSGYPTEWDFHQNPYSEYDGKRYPTEWDFHQTPNKEYDGIEYPTPWDFHHNPYSEYDGSGYPEKHSLTNHDEGVPSWQIPLEQYPINYIPENLFEHRNIFVNDQLKEKDPFQYHKDIMHYDSESKSDEYSLSSESYEYSEELSYLPSKGLHIPEEDHIIWNGHTHNDHKPHHSDSESHEISEEDEEANGYQSHEYPNSYSVPVDKNRFTPDNYGSSEEDVYLEDNDANQESGYIDHFQESKPYEMPRDTGEEYTIGNSASEEKATADSSDESSNSEYGTKAWPAHSHLNQRPWGQEDSGGNVADHWIQVPRGKNQGKQNGFSWKQVPSTPSQIPERNYWGGGSKTRPKVPYKEPVHTSTYPQNNIYDGTGDFNQWFKKQLQVIKNSGTKIPTDAADINIVRGAIEATLRDNGLRVTSTGTLQDANGKISKLSNLKLRPLLIGRSVPYNHFVKASSMYNVPAKTPFLEGLLVTMLNPPKILGIVPLGITALSRKLSPNGDQVVEIEGRKLHPNTHKALTGILGKRPGAYSTQTAVLNGAPLTDGSNSDLKQIWQTFSDILKKDNAVMRRAKLNNYDGDPKIIGRYNEDDDDDDDDNDEHDDDDYDHDDDDDDNDEHDDDDYDHDDDDDDEATPGFRIIGGSSATGTGTPLANRGRSGQPFFMKIGLLK